MRLLLIPGLVCDESVWRGQVHSLSALMRTDFFIGETCSIESMAAAALATNAGPLIVVGHSLGGRIALEMVRQAPERVHGVALLNSGYRQLPAGEAGEREVAGRRALLQVARQEGLRAMALRWLPPMLHAKSRSDNALVESLVGMIERCSLSRYEKQLQALVARPDATEVLRQLRCPLLLLTGHQDGWSPWARHAEMAALAAHSVLIGVHECGHMSPVERPEQVAVALQHWLRQQVLDRPWQHPLQ